MHTVVGAGAAEGAMDAGNMLKPMLARGELHMIGATTLDEYRKHVEKDPALERRFQPVLVDEPSVEETISILRGLKERYEVHHGVRITDPAVIAAATLSTRYIADRHLPDKAIDLIDEAAARLRTEIDSKPQALDEVDRQIMQLEIEREALKKEKDKASKERLERLEKELADLKERSSQLNARWQTEKEAIASLRKTKEQIEQTRLEMERAERQNNYEAAARLRYGTLRELEKKLAESEARMKAMQAEGALLKEEVDAEEIASVVARWTGIPVSRLLEGEMEKLVHMEERLHAARGRAGRGAAGGRQRGAARARRSARPQPADRLVHLPGADRRGQDRAGARPGGVPVRRRAGDDPHRHERVPGEAHRLAAGRRAARLRGLRGRRAADRSGAPPPVQRGAVRRDREGAQRGVQRAAAAAGRRSPDRRAGAHGGFPQHGGDHDLQPGQRAVDGRACGSRPRDAMTRVLQAHFRPEFLNRIDEIVVFHPLSREHIAEIVDIQLRRVADLLAERGYTLEVSEAAREYLAEAGYDPDFGARPLKRAIQRELQDPLALRILSGEFHEGDLVRVDRGAEGLSFTPVVQAEVVEE